MGSMNDLTGKVAVITGAGSGIGRAFALELAERNCNLALISFTEANLKETAKRITNKNIKVSIHTVDVADKKQVHSMAKEVLETHGNVTYLINNAGVAADGDFMDLKEETLERVMQVNFFGQVYMLKAFLPHMVTLPEAHVINMSSLYGRVATPRQSAYSASKYAVRGFSKVLALELEESNVKIHIVYPGAVNTNVVQNAIRNEKETPKELAEMMKEIIANGMQPKEAVDIILDGVQKGKQDIIVGKDAKLCIRLARLFPMHYWSIIKSSFSKKK